MNGTVRIYGVRGGRVTSYIWHSTDVRAEWPLFQRCQVYDWPPFSTKSIWMARFFWIPMWKAPFFWNPGICTYLSLRDFSRRIDCEICLKPAINGYKKPNGSIWIGQHFGWSRMNGSVFSKARYMNGVGFEILARTSVPQLHLSYTPPPRPTTPEMVSNYLRWIWYIAAYEVL